MLVRLGGGLGLGSLGLGSLGFGVGLAALRAVGGDLGALVVGAVEAAAFEGDPDRVEHLLQRAHALWTDAERRVGHVLESFQLVPALGASVTVDRHLTSLYRARPGSRGGKTIPEGALG